MRVIDLTHLLTRDMPVYPGTEQPAFLPVSTCEKDGFRETKLSLCSHVGTHMDGPAHIMAQGVTLDALPPAHFVGKATVIDCSDIAPGGAITMEHVRCNSWVAQADFLLFYTGWSRYWGKTEYFAQFPCIAEDVVDWVIQTGKKGIGLDTISLDPVGSVSLHRRLFSQSNAVIIENLADLDKVPAGLFTLCALPLRFENSDGAPVRAVALLEY